MAVSVAVGDVGLGGNRAADASARARYGPGVITGATIGGRLVRSSTVILGLLLTAAVSGAAAGVPFANVATAPPEIESSGGADGCCGARGFFFLGAGFQFVLMRGKGAPWTTSMKGDMSSASLGEMGEMPPNHGTSDAIRRTERRMCDEKQRK